MGDREMAKFHLDHRGADEKKSKRKDITQRGGFSDMSKCNSAQRCAVIVDAGM